MEIIIRWQLHFGNMEAMRIVETGPILPEFIWKLWHPEMCQKTAWGSQVFGDWVPWDWQTGIGANTRQQLLSFFKSSEGCQKTGLFNRPGVAGAVL